MYIVVALIILLIALYLGFKIEHHLATKRHVKLFKENLQDELRQVQAEKLATPGGNIEKV